MDRICAMTGRLFVVTDDELAFLDRVSPFIGGKKLSIPPPTLCPDARQQRRLTFRNERVFYHRACSRCDRKIIALYPADAVCPVYCGQCYWGDGWDALAYGRSFDPAQSFFRQFDQLQRTVPHLFFSSTNNENSEYCNHAGFMKDCYLVHGSMHSRNCHYSTRVFRCTDCTDCLFINDCELCYECVNCDECYDLRHAYHCAGCFACRWVQHCHGSRDLLFCVNRRQARYQVLNVQQTKEEYERIRAEVESSPEVRDRYLDEYRMLLLSVPVPSRISDQAEDCTGNFLRQCRRCHDTFDAQKCQDIVHGFDIEQVNDSCDIYSVYAPGELCYELYSAHHVHSTLFSHDCWPADNLLYCDHCFGCKNCFGCLGLTKKEHCILNKQCTKEEYEKLVPEIVDHMSRIGEFGEFFPVQSSPFAYNETTAQEYFWLKKEEVVRRGWRWRDQIEEKPKVDRTIPASQVPASIDATPDDILNWAVECENTKRPFRIIRKELDFYRKMRVPVPIFHPDERHKRRMAMRNPRKLWERECAKCGKGMKTSFAPEKPEKVFCEECYLTEVY
ncbi:MAG: hypothetical protein PHZ00_07280 [Candidatus Peribacteraceae bacterium]|nr:hypothetical protein [Candidatus Peribacteraceae bacterium]